MASFNIQFKNQKDFQVNFTKEKDVKVSFGDIYNHDIIIQTGDYEKLINKPSVNGVTLVGNKTGEDLHLQNKMNVLSVTDIEKILYLD